MKSFSFLLMAVIMGFQLNAQQRCSHGASFEKSGLSDTLDAISYTISMDDFDFENESFSAKTVVELMSKIDDLQEVTLELQDLTVDSVFIGGDKADGYTHQGFFLHIPLTETLNTGELVTVTVFYHGQPFHEAWGGFHWSGEYCFNLGVGFESIPHNLGKTWFPCIDDFRDRAFYDLYVTVAEGKDAVCGGILESITDNGDGTRTYYWSMGQSIPTYLASVAVGDYARWTDTYSGTENDIPIEIWIRPIDSSKVDLAFAKLNQIMGIFEDSYGPYRWDRVGYVGTAIGAMEHACNIAYPHFSIGSGIGNESLYTHELSHMWFGDNVTCSSAEEMWLNEGWAVFSEALYREFVYGKESYLEFLRDTHAGVIQYCHTPGKDGSYFPLNQIPQEITYGMSAYDRGATVAHSMRGYLGDDLFFDAIAAYNDHFQHNYASSYDMRDYITEYTGIDMTDWFDNWVLNSGTPHYSVDSFAVTTGSSGYDVTVYLRQKRHGPAFTGNSNKIELTFRDQGWNHYSAEVMFDGETGMQTVNVPFFPDFILPDFNEKQCDAITDHKETITEPGSLTFTKTYFEMEVESVDDSAFVYAGHQWAPPDPLATPIQGLTLSDYRYWVIDGIFPEGFNATGIFWYNRNTYLDDGIITSEEDSVILMYRPSPAFDWQFVDFTKIGLWNIGKLYVENLQKGQYTIAVADDTFVGINESETKTGFRVFPNPNRGGFNIEVNQPGTLKIYDVAGNLLDKKEVSDHLSLVEWQPAGLTDGTYIVQFCSLKQTVLGVEQIVVLKN